VRRGRAGDAEAIRALTREAYAKWVGVIGCEPLPMQIDYSAALRKHRFDLLSVDDRLAALIETVREGDCLLIESRLFPRLNDLFRVRSEGGRG